MTSLLLESVLVLRLFRKRERERARTLAHVYFDGRERKPYWLNMLETISISASAAAIFSAEEGWGRPWPKRKDIFGCVVCVCGLRAWVCRCAVVV